MVIATVLLIMSNGCTSGVYHQVQAGQTLYRISRTYGVEEDYLARINGIDDPRQLKIGTRLYIPGAERVLPVPSAQSAAAPQRTKIKPRTPTGAKKQPLAPSRSVRTTKKNTANPTPPATAVAPATAVKKLRWPLRGKIVSSFSSKAGTGGGKGIEIAVRAGSPVVAAEAGKVIYSGDAVKGYGHLIILQHENNFFTVYGFNQRNLVRQGDFVSQGEKIALSGTPPAGGASRLHFEVRQGKTAVDPILYLP